MMSSGLKNMTSASEILNKICLFIITIFMPLSLQCSHVLVAADALLDYTVYTTSNVNPRGRFGPYFTEGSGNVDENQIKRVPGKDENDYQEPLVVQRFKALLGLNSFSKPRKGNAEYLSPAPSPSTTEAESPAPVPPRHIRRHFHRSPHQPLAIQPNHSREQDKYSGKKTLVIVLVSTGGAAFVVCALGVFLVYGKFAKQRKKSFTYSKKGEKGGRSRSGSSARKMSLNPGIDLRYLESLGVDLEQQHSCFKQTASTLLHERVECVEEARNSGSDNVSSSSTREIMSVHEYEGTKSLPDEKVIKADSNSSDDELFHSCGASQRSNVRLSNASVGSLTETIEMFPLDEPKIASPQLSPRNLSDTTGSFNDNAYIAQYELHSQSLEAGKLPVRCSTGNPNAFTPPPPPPPPPPSSHSFLKRVTLLSSSSTFPNLSYSRASNSSSDPKQVPECQLSSLPEKPPAVSNIPDPPHPPPSREDYNNSIKTPPPPPSLPSQFSTVGKNGAPLPKLKPLHWDKVRATPDRTMVWDKLRSSSFEFDEEMMESLFGYDMPSSVMNDEARSKTPSPSKHVLEPKRLQNITILAKALNATADQVCIALLHGNGLCLQQLEALVKMVPTKEEAAKLAKYGEDITKLGSAEQFVKKLLGVPYSFLRIEAMLYRETFEDEVVHLKNSFLMLEEACQELRSSRLFLKLLEAVLKTGNRMNVGTIRGGAKAFKLDALLKLADVKGTDGKTTLLHFVVQEIIRSEGIRVSESIMGKISQRSESKTIQEKEEDYKRMGLDLVSGLTTELYNVKKTAAIDLDVLASSVSNLSEGKTKMQYLVKDLSKEEKSEKFVNSMRTFLVYAEKNLKELQEGENNVLVHVREITEYFHGHVSKDDTNPLRIFVIVRDFLGMLDHVCKELRSIKTLTTPNPLAPFR